MRYLEPFGYKMKNGELQVKKEESQIVKLIFDQYLQGESLLGIAKSLDGKVWYDEPGKAWNKNMVKRILENSKYIGCEGFPAIIEADIFQQAAQLKNSKCKPNTPSVFITAMKEKLKCSACGEAMKRKNDKWYCINKECATNLGYKTVPLQAKVIELCNKMLVEPEVLVIPDFEKPAFSLERQRLTKEFDRALEIVHEEAPLIELVLQITANTYNDCMDGSQQYQYKQIKATLQQHKPSDCFNKELFESAVENVIIYNEEKIALQLKTGQILDM